MKVRLGGEVRGRWSLCLIRRGRWSEGSSSRASQLQRVAKSGVARVMSGEVGVVLVLYGLRVGVSGLLSMTML